MEEHSSQGKGTSGPYMNSNVLGNLWTGVEKQEEEDYGVKDLWREVENLQLTSYDDNSNTHSNYESYMPLLQQVLAPGYMTAPPSPPPYPPPFIDESSKQDHLSEFLEELGEIEGPDSEERKDNVCPSVSNYLYPSTKSSLICEPGPLLDPAGVPLLEQNSLLQKNEDVREQNEVEDQLFFECIDPSLFDLFGILGQQHQ
ncbi:hypothetical protein SUGI_0408550 [Cryptomeria japonica]|nr:hypothetical protein SUGI_0408550 [Cryptomeria japonica]